MRLSLLGVVALASSALVGSASATTYTSSGTFLPHVAPGAYFNDFSSVASGSSAALSFSGGGYSYIVNSSSTADDLYNDTGLISTNFDDESILITFTGAPVTAVGGNFWSTNINVAPVSSPIVLALSDGTFETYTSSSASDYRGFITSVPITSMVISDGAASVWPTLDNLTVGAAAPTPEPATLSMLGGVIVTALRRRRA